jgi:hypothetical protein
MYLQVRHEEPAFAGGRLPVLPALKEEVMPLDPGVVIPNPDPAYRMVSATMMAGDISAILYGTVPKEANIEWAKIPLILKLLLLWMGEELQWLVSCATATPKTIEGLSPPADALERIDRLQTSLRTPWIIAEEELTPEQVALAKDMLAIVEPPPTP